MGEPRGKNMDTKKLAALGLTKIDEILVPLTQVAHTWLRPGKAAGGCSQMYVTHRTLAYAKLKEKSKLHPVLKHKKGVPEKLNTAHLYWR
jgi:hypothetical protein